MNPAVLNVIHHRQKPLDSTHLFCSFPLSVISFLTSHTLLLSALFSKSLESCSSKEIRKHIKNLQNLIIEHY
jgi:hypothetical protein